MFHMVTTFTLAEGESIEAFQQALQRFSDGLIRRDLLQQTGPVGRRCLHPVMDTDEQRDHEYFFLMSFSDRAQCDRSVEHIYAVGAHTDPDHLAILEKLDQAVFSCWEDL